MYKEDNNQLHSGKWFIIAETHDHPIQLSKWSFKHKGKMFYHLNET